MLKEENINNSINFCLLLCYIAEEYNNESFSFNEFLENIFK